MELPGCCLLCPRVVPSMTESIHVRCKGRVVRTEENGTSGGLSIAAVIDEYEFLAGA